MRVNRRIPSSACYVFHSPVEGSQMGLMLLVEVLPG
jgi:hypothetical protein